jgi:hypothetical protein
MVWRRTSYTTKVVLTTKLLSAPKFAFPSFMRTAFWAHHIYARPPSIDTAQLTFVRQLFDDPNFVFALKHDGFRALAHLWDGQGKDRTFSSFLSDPQLSVEKEPCPAN